LAALMAGAARWRAERRTRTLLLAATSAGANIPASETRCVELLGPTVPIRYIGSKARKLDTVHRTAIEWNGLGDVQAYPADKAAALLKFDDVWQLATTKTGPRVVPGGDHRRDPDSSHTGGPSPNA
jgi:hypothetical protein